MVNPERDKLSGVVEVDETFVGGVTQNKTKNNQTHKNKSVIVALTSSATGAVFLFKYRKSPNISVGALSK